MQTVLHIISTTDVLNSVLQTLQTDIKFSGSPQLSPPQTKSGKCLHNQQGESKQCSQLMFRAVFWVKSHTGQSVLTKKYSSWTALKRTKERDIKCYVLLNRAYT
jgi:hypothetical protein